MRRGKQGAVHAVGHHGDAPGVEPVDPGELAAVECGDAEHAVEVPELAAQLAPVALEGQVVRPPEGRLGRGGPPEQARHALADQHVHGVGGGEGLEALAQGGLLGGRAEGQVAHAVPAAGGLGADAAEHGDLVAAGGQLAGQVAAGALRAAQALAAGDGGAVEAHAGHAEGIVHDGSPGLTAGG